MRAHYGCTLGKLVVFIIMCSLPGYVLSTESGMRDGQAEPKRNSSKIVNKKTEFILRAGRVVQSISIERVSKNRIKFLLIIDGACRKSISGTAVKAQGDYELEEDELGETYPAESFTYEGKNGYSLNIRMAVRTDGYLNDKAILLEAGNVSGCGVVVETMHIVNK